ncbi:anhydro-N-acetylmuramic acid kinase [Virgibacillus halodenitrificans]|uniref:anhydro-N-acetylmuramic acid kinase n=1 Tax=Virgibacillus halodenitrificans TaxID=1482 RepID=UPI001F2D7605|nr:anhydro-N-acetylmuramic acid kinase [Virgibacillus halodenitrificans]MCG1027254.1 anhydro-N-acetylmuramic acid kinase [Virgibacillus halodenitrificans]
MNILAVGLMSGTSVDGIDAVLVKINSVNENIKIEVVESLEIPYSNEERTELLLIADNKSSSLEKICSANFYLGKKFGQTVNLLLEKAKVRNDDIHFISSHGHTVYHQPVTGEGMLNEKSTLQIGDISVIAQLTGIATVGDFRPADIAVGGDGAPLISYVDYMLFGNEDCSRAIQNIGGIGNVTYVPKGADSDKVMAFDTGPGNMVIDEIVYRMTDGKEKYDKDGLYAYQGKINKQLLEELNSHKYLSVDPPKTTGREQFGKHFLDEILVEYNDVQPIDLITTVSEWTAMTITDSYKNFLLNKGKDINEIIIGGGGSYNPYLVERIAYHLPEAKVKLHEEHGISSNLKEALGFAMLGYQCLRGEYNQIPSATGAQAPVIMGKISYTNPSALKQLETVRRQ